MQIAFILILVIAIIVAIFAIQNGTLVPIDLFIVRYEMPLVLIMMICLILGAIIVLILGTTRQFKKRSEQKELKSKIKTFETEKAQNEINIKALESDKQELKATNEGLSKKITELEDKRTELEASVNKLKDEIKIQAEALNAEIYELKTAKQNMDNGKTVSEIIDEGVAQIANEDSEAESQ